MTLLSSDPNAGRERIEFCERGRLRIYLHYRDFTVGESKPYAKVQHSSANRPSLSC